MNKEIIINNLKEKFKDFDKDIQTFDFFAEYDNNISPEENNTILTEKINDLIGRNLKELVKEQKSQEGMLKEQQQEFMLKYEEEFNILSKENLNKFKTIAIYGDIGTGKTALAYRIIKNLDKKTYFIKHPKPYLIKPFGYENILSLERLESLNNCVVYWDEPQLTTSIYDKKANSIIAKVCSLARQRNITLIISSSDTRVFTKHNESYFDLWLIKDLDYSMVKNGSKIRKAVKDNSILDPFGFCLNKDEFLSESRTLKELNGKHRFKLIELWNEDISKPYYIAK
jgi:hypothetical protein